MLALFSLGIVAFAASAQDYPAHAVRVVVPFGPGTGMDLVARIWAERLTTSTGQPFVVENKAGAAGTIGEAAVAAATPDGYTLLVNASGHTTVPALMKNVPYDAQKDFVSISMIGESPMVLVSSRGRFDNVGALVAAGKARPGALTYASAGVGTMTQLAAEKFRMAAGFDALHVPYKSTTDALAEVMSGRIDYLVTTLPSALGPVKDGRMTALAMGLRRSAKVPTVPTLAEAGVKNAESSTWFGVFGPAKLPRSVVVKLQAETTKALASPEFKEKLDNIGAEAYPMSTAEFDAVVRKDFIDNAQLIKAAGIKLE